MRKQGQLALRPTRGDVEDYIADAYRRTAERIAPGEVEDGAEDGNQE